MGLGADNAVCKQELIASSPPGLDSRRFNRAGWNETWPLLAAVFVFKERIAVAW